MRNQVGAVRFVGSFVDAVPDLGLPEVAFAGRSNVGKSSALNCLLDSKKAARVSGRPGRTQLINLFQVGTACGFVDLPGYGFAKVPDHVQEQWGPMIERYLSSREALRLVVVLVDARREPQEMDGTLLTGLRDAGIRRLVVATKIDKLKRSQRARHLAAIRQGFDLDPEALLPFSSVTREGRGAVWSRIEAACRPQRARRGTPIVEDLSGTS